MFSKKTLCAICKKAKFSKLFSTACQINLVAMTKVQKSWGTIHFKWIRLFFWLLLFHVPTKVFKKKQFLVDRLQHFRLGLQRWLNFSCFHRNLLVNIFVSRLFHIFSFITWQLSASFYWKTFSLTELTLNKTLFFLIVINGSSFWLVNFLPPIRSSHAWPISLRWSASTPEAAKRIEPASLSSTSWSECNFQQM